jgi:hypothetical protein
MDFAIDLTPGAVATVKVGAPMTPVPSKDAGVVAAGYVASE